MVKAYVAGDGRVLAAAVSTFYLFADVKKELTAWACHCGAGATRRRPPPERGAGATRAGPAGRAAPGVVAAPLHQGRRQAAAPQAPPRTGSTAGTRRRNGC